MASISEVLLSINQVLSGYDSEVKKATDRITRLQVTGKERVDIREDIKQKLDKAGIKYEQKKLPGSGFEGIEIEESYSSVLRILFKTPGGGSGGGAALTKLAESAQAVYAAIAFGLGREITNADVTSANVKKYKDFFDVDGDMDEILNKLPDIWIESSVLGANKLYDEFKRLKGIKFHRGDSVVKNIEDQFKRIKHYSYIQPSIDEINLKDSIELSNVDFSYNGDINILKNINLVIRKGEHIGICGQSGCGKSTLLDIIIGFYAGIYTHFM